MTLYTEQKNINIKKTREIKTSDVKRVNLVQIGLWIFFSRLEEKNVS